MEDNTIEEDATIYLLPPEEQTAETDEDSDRSDDEHEGDINHLGHGSLKTVCELQTQESDWESEDDLPLSSFFKRKQQITKRRTGVKLLRHLANEGYCASGTVRQGRMDNCPLPDKNFWNKQKRGSAMFKTSEQVTIAQWKDNKVVSGASNYEEPATAYTNRWCRLAKAKVPIPQPVIFSNYNKGMGGVDKTDGLIAAYRTRMHQRKWWWPIFVYMFDVSVKKFGHITFNNFWDQIHTRKDICSTDSFNEVRRKRALCSL
ncbi:hypothetical protein CBL_12838 [Carabus blaptoides fortunei]